tara:strand:- start:2671 stop:3855 length:1185 start_codon:yes stop_codon:yes gene_type:complete
MKVLLRAPLMTSSGYGVHSRQLMRWLLSRKDIELHVECLRWGQCSWMVDTRKEDGLIAEITKRAVPLQSGTYDVTFQVQLPDEWDDKLGKVNIGVTAAVETDKCNPDWVKSCNKMDHIIVPSTFTKNVIKRSGMLTTKISVIQEWYNPIIDDNQRVKKTLKQKKFKQIKGNFNFLVLGQITSMSTDGDRKNLINTLAAIFDEFKHDESVGIVLKTSLGKSTTMDKISTRNFLCNILPQMRKGKNPLYFVHGDLEPEEVCALYRHKSIKAFAIATRGEGYGLPLIESAASGLPIVTTRWSGHLEFLNTDLFKSVNYKLIDIPKAKVDNRIFMEGARWAEPDLYDFKGQARKIHDDYTSSKKDADKLKLEITEKFNKTVIMQKYDKLLLGVVNNDA